ncbi:MAG: helicase-related protein, partial [Geminicoccales bacterium]
DFGEFAANPNAKGIAAENARRALRDVLGYRLYYDLRRGWRITNPNLEQLGVLQIDYVSLDEACADAELWASAPDPLALAPGEVRRAVATLLLDTMRRQLCIKTRYLDRFEQEQILNRSHNFLKEPWGFAEDERQLMEAAVFFPVPEPPGWRGEYRATFASVRSRLGRQLARPGLWGGAESPCFPGRLNDELFRVIVGRMLVGLEQYGIAERIEVAGLGEGWRVNAAALRWTRGDGRPTAGGGLRTTDNPFFRALYENLAAQLGAGQRLLHRLEAREHTAQVDAAAREEREERFRAAELPVLFCSPTMELGVDIAELNTVYLRNLPPTPANYAQRSGRAGRSGQPALVLAYAAAKSPHDQYFFRNPIRMVAGAVNPPTLDLANED